MVVGDYHFRLDVGIPNLVSADSLNWVYMVVLFLQLLLLHRLELVFEGDIQDVDMGVVTMEELGIPNVDGKLPILHVRADFSECSSGST